MYLGLTTSHVLRLPNGSEVGVRQISEAQSGTRFGPGAPVQIGWRTADARLHIA
ncbi:MAG: TOBE domain-containing protein [Candidatus Methylomirabilia bacterium]